MKKIWLTLSIMASAMLMTGCSDDTDQKTGDDPLLKSIVIKAPVTNDYEDASYQIADATKAATNALAKLAKVQTSQHPDYYKTPQKVVKSNVKGTISLNYIGPIEPLLKKIAKHAKLKFKKMGKSTGTPIIVSVKYENSTLADAIENIAYQAQNHAVVEITKSGAVQIRYIEI
jgi:defect-in-organelle-trafficking protein DotD